MFRLSADGAMKLTKNDVLDRLVRITELASDDEAAHSEQDEMFREVLTAIASGDVGLRQARSISEAALKVDEIRFSRWMA